ncbi:MAG TPA: hypothetical protein VLJ42_03305 [Solirubrobacteraceae bacterium]|nr:hypothetical protein [Solirubrobacteraceae bacterium]
MSPSTYSVALVQNQSEMAHYGYADARPLLGDYNVHLITGDNIASLPDLLASHEVDALVLASNALNDRDILATVNCAAFAETLAEYLDAGRGAMCLQQLGLAMRDGPRLECLPHPLSRLRPVVTRGGGQPLGASEFVLGSNTARHVVLTYPHQIDAAEMQKHATGLRHLPGLSWHHLEDADLSDWDELLIDRGAPQPRSLLLTAKESTNRRLVVSALPLDWQRHELLFTNLLVYVTEGRHNIATVRAADKVDVDYDYLRASLRAQRVAFGEYVMPDDAQRAGRNIDLGIHSTLLLSPSIGIEGLPEPLGGAVAAAVRAGRMRLVNFGPGAFGTRSMSIVSRELRPKRLLEATELQIQTELRNGYIDDSFWSHVETLQTLETLPRADVSGRAVDYAHVQDAAFAIVRNHERNGSYDEVFGPTCALYWLRAQYLGTDSAPATASADWLRGALERCESEERALAYLTFARLGPLSDDERADLERAATSFVASEASETKLVLYLRASVMAGLPASAIATLSEALISAQDLDGTWVDLTTTATAASALLGARVALIEQGDRHRALIEVIDSSAHAAVVYILRRLARSEAVAHGHPYPWDGKASTTVKCLQAWLRFDELQDLPVFDLLEGLRRGDAAATQYASSRTALSVLQETNEENAALRASEAVTSESLHAAETALAKTRADLVTWRIALGASGVVLYVTLALLVGALIAKQRGFEQAFKTGVVDGWYLHSAFAIPLTLALVRYVYVRWDKSHRTASG